MGEQRAARVEVFSCLQRMSALAQSAAAHFLPPQGHQECEQCAMRCWLMLLLLNWVRATPDRPFMSSKSSSQTRLIAGSGAFGCMALNPLLLPQLVAAVPREQNFTLPMAALVRT